MNAFVSSFAAPVGSSTRISHCPRTAPAAKGRTAVSTTRMGAYEEFYSSRKNVGPDSSAPDPSLYTEHYPEETLHFAPQIAINEERGIISVASSPVPLGDSEAPVDAAAYAGSADPALWERYFPRSRVNMAPHISIVPGESVALTQKVIYADVESAQRSAAQDAKFESGWSAGWRPTPRW